MIGAALRRIGWTVVVVWFVVTATFVMTAAIPADPVRALLGPHATAETIARVRAHYCLDRGFAVQYGCWIDRLAHGDLGESYRSQRPVSEIIVERLWPTVQLAVGALALQLLLGVPLGVLAGALHRRWADRGVVAMAMLGQSMPAFLMATLLIYVFAYRWGWFPLSGYGTGGWDRIAHLVLPAMTIAAFGIAYYARVVRAEMIDVLREDYVRTARAKGVHESRVIVRHALRNALGPLVTLVGLELGALLGGSVVIEVIFAWPGLGAEIVHAILEVDIPLILGVVLVSAIAVAVSNMLVDLVYLWVDPRLRRG